jgi:hypothetical protein
MKIESHGFFEKFFCNWNLFGQIADLHFSTMKKKVDRFDLFDNGLSHIIGGKCCYKKNVKM